MNTKTFRAFLAMGALATAAASSWGCVAERPARNGVFNENQYVRKEFIVRPADGSKGDPGWIMKSTIVSTSTPNPLGPIFLAAGDESGGALVRFVVLQDKLQLANVREIGPVDATQGNRIPEVVNAWPVTNVDLKYRINLDGEKTNFYEENQELDWQTRQWVKVNFAKNDMSDLAAFGSYAQYFLEQCTDLADASAALVPSSFLVDEPHDYMQWTVQLTLPIKFDNDGCNQSYGEAGANFQRLGRNAVTMNVMYSFMRAKTAEETTYTPLEVAEKDPIQHKYGPLKYTSFARDPDSGMLAARALVLRFDPNKENTWYFAKGYPEEYKAMFLQPGGIVDQTNEIFAKVGAQKLVVKNFDADLPEGECSLPGVDAHKQCPREYGDVRYSFLRWMWDPDGNGGAGWAGVTQFVPDPRTGEALSSSINIAGFEIKDYYVQHIDAYLRSVGASNDVNSAKWPDGPKDCKDGDVMPLVQSIVQADHNQSSTLFAKMQIALQRPPSGPEGFLGPVDFVAQHPATDDFWKAYYAVIPYGVFADPATNQFVTPEGFGGVFGGPGEVMDRYKKEHQFQVLAAQIDRGENPFSDVTGAEGLKNATSFMNSMRDLTINHRELEYIKPLTHPLVKRDTTDLVTLQAAMQRDARHCVFNDPTNTGGGTHWESRDEWINNLIHTYWTQVVWHEFGHSLGLDHNFMASVDKPNYPHYTDSTGRDHVGLYASSVMEYNAAPDRVFWKEGWAPYDKGAIAWIYGNAHDAAHAHPVAPEAGKVADGISGQVSPTAPWNDAYGFAYDGSGAPTGEKQFLFCNDTHMKYTPLCRQGDMGSTPSEIIANAIDAYEWNYQFRNFRTYRKYWDDSPYANAPAALITDMRKFMSLWVFDWNSDELSDTFRRIGIVNPDPNGSQLEYYNGLENKFNAELSAANSMVAAFHNAVIQQSSGERPYRSIYDKYYGDVTQQGIILDKFFAMQGFTALWPTDNYDVNQAGSYLASYEGLGDSFFNFVAEQTVDTMIGGQYDVFPWFVPSAVAQFAQDTHSPSFGGRREVRDWIGGHVFYRLQDFLDYFRDLAVQNSLPGCTDIGACKYDPRVPGVSDNHNEFLGPDKRLWAWAYIADRNTWLAVQKERNTASYIIVRDYNNDVITSQDDGAQPGQAYQLQLPMKYTLDAFNAYN